ncbi:bacillithiol biosynthesis cysteine-adding enzyme BshC [Jeotgalibacillus proteolyticus]|uniref:Putative cysteine ligase BshC n=1 Tax=Jeotgalibacillus proteolyticus TaxID=2082395 RepID=A0A2S5GGU5_9BACL|nr:bacillithiol biosynthesis cysteine-adding enzyme BshC [Jeotgalibacillus proteolyticus]PPA72144.1 bacillithiol biosynthesis cysteine-adding enzyme BshC [Jeotgalibacillus proteolyticus]
MQLENIKLPAIQPFTSGYMNQDEKILSNFHYGFNGPEAYDMRKKELLERSYKREELADCIEDYMSSLPGGEAVKSSIEKLRNNGFVVIGGQQAGLLTGPLYAIHKVLSIIQLAKKQEELLNHPVVPVFWIAGEDHDYLEINHLFIEHNGEMKKAGYPERVTDKRMASSTPFDKETMKKWVRSILRDLGETSNTLRLIEKLDAAIQNSATITDLFAHIVMDLYKEDGLLVIDAARPELRKLETPFFKELLQANEQITDLVHKQQTLLKKEGFTPMIEAASNAVNLFITINNERVLLFRTEDGFKDKNNEYFFEKDELLCLMDESPERFSNNVITRPLMQEWLFPTLAFIAGPGEIAYWAELKTAFEKMEMKMPPIMPRLNITFVERDVQQKVKELNLHLPDILAGGADEEKKRFWESVKDETLENYIRETESFLREQYELIKEKAAELHPGLTPIVDKNLTIHEKQLDFLKRKSDDYISLKHNVVLRKYDRVTASLRPNGGPQERQWNIFYFINKYGEDFIPQLSKIDFKFDHSHKIVYL